MGAFKGRFLKDKATLGQKETHPNELSEKMFYPEELDYWIEEVSTGFCQLSKTQAQVLGLYSYEMAMTFHSGQTIVSTF